MSQQRVAEPINENMHSNLGTTQNLGATQKQDLISASFSCNDREVSDSPSQLKKELSVEDMQVAEEAEKDSEDPSSFMKTIDPPPAIANSPMRQIEETDRDALKSERS